MARDLGSSARLRRMANTSESSDDSGIDVGNLGIFSEKYRVSTPPMYQLPLNCLPYNLVDDFGPLPPSLDETFEFDMKPHLVKVFLVPSGILGDKEYHCLQLQWRSPPEHDNLRLLAVVIRAVWSSNSERSGDLAHLTTWEYAAVQCRNWVNDHPAVRQFRRPDNPYPIHVEIIAPQLRRDRYFSPADKYLDVYNLWIPTIKGILHNYNLDQYLQSMTMLRSGYKLPRESNPLTILVTLYRDCQVTKAWAYAEGVIRAHIRNQCDAPDVDVSIEWGDLSHTAFEILPPEKTNEVLYRPDVYRKNVNLGDNIGVGKYHEFQKDGRTYKHQSGCGTLGGYIEYKTTTESKWRKVALTCYHVVRPAFPGFQLTRKPIASAPTAVATGDGSQNTANTLVTVVGAPINNSLLANLDKNGFRPAGSIQNRRQYIIEAPSRSLHNHTVTMIKHQLSSMENVAPQSSYIANRRELLKTAVTFFNEGKQVLGHPGFGSGYARRRNNRRMDWAAIEVQEDRRGINALPSPEEWVKRWEERKYLSGYIPKKFPPTIRSPPTTPITPRLNAQYFAKGGVSGYTAGRINGVKGEVRLRDDKHVNPNSSEELVFLCPKNERQQAASPSDSGAWVWNEESQLVAIIFAGMIPYGDAEGDILTYVERIHDVFDDIKDFSGGRISEIRVADAS